MDADIITVKEAAARLHVAVNTIYNWITDGRLTYQDGLFRVRRRTLFHWPTLKARRSAAAWTQTIAKGVSATLLIAHRGRSKWPGCMHKMGACC